MRVKEYLILFTLAALWGASFLFIKVSVSEISPLLLVFVRLAVGTLGMLVFVPFMPGVMKGWHKKLGAFVLVAIFNAVIPYLSISWGEQHVTSGMAAIINATTPLVLVIISIWWGEAGERPTLQRISAVAVGFIGVGVLVGPAALTSNSSNLFLLGVLSCLLGSASYAVGGLLVRRLLLGRPLMQQAIGQIGVGAVMLAPFTIGSLALEPLTHIPSFWAIASALALALGGTSIAYLCYFWLIGNVGPTRTLIVTYLLPCFALVYGAILLNETISLNAIAGLVLVLAGIFLAGKKPTPKATPSPEPALVESKQTGGES